MRAAHSSCKLRLDRAQLRENLPRVSEKLQGQAGGGLSRTWQQQLPK